MNPSHEKQVEEIKKLKPKKVLEIGVGNGDVSKNLKARYSTVTLDIDKKLNPDIVSDVRGMPFEENSFDLVLCAEVLEHIPFKHFRKAISEICRVTRKYAVITLPRTSSATKPITKNLILKRIGYPLPHYWEIDWLGTPYSKVKRIISERFEVLDDYRFKQKPNHHFFILSKLPE